MPVVTVIDRFVNRNVNNVLRSNLINVFGHTASRTLHFAAASVGASQYGVMLLFLLTTRIALLAFL